MQRCVGKKIEGDHDDDHGGKVVCVLGDVKAEDSKLAEDLKLKHLRTMYVDPGTVLPEKF
eukprot:9040102-Ditylum_brightwellii.AAC.1